MKTMCLPSYHHNVFAATHTLGHMMYGCTVHHESSHHVPKSMSCQLYPRSAGEKFF